MLNDVTCCDDVMTIVNQTILYVDDLRGNNVVYHALVYF